MPIIESETGIAMTDEHLTDEEIRSLFEPAPTPLKTSEEDKYYSQQISRAGEKGPGRFDRKKLVKRPNSYEDYKFAPDKHQRGNNQVDKGEYYDEERKQEKIASMNFEDEIEEVKSAALEKNYSDPNNKQSELIKDEVLGERRWKRYLNNKGEFAYNDPMSKEEMETMRRDALEEQRRNEEEAKREKRLRGFGHDHKHWTLY